VQKRSYTSTKVFGLFAFFAFEMVFAAHKLHEQADEGTVRSVLELPAVGAWYYNYRTRDLQTAAGRGNVSAMMTLHRDAIYFDQEEKKDQAMHQIRMSPSPTARLYSYEYDIRSSSRSDSLSRMSEREMMLLHARVMKENVRPDFRDTSGELFIQQSQRNALALTSILQKARRGDSDAQWLVGELARQ
jgi:hypothetical protein